MKKVLIIEKDNYTAEVLAESLIYFNCIPVVYDSNKSLAIELIEAAPDVIIIHRSLFVRNRQLFISSMNPGERLLSASIILTSNALLDPERLRELGAHFFLFKPFDLQVLSEVLKRVDLIKLET